MSYLSAAMPKNPIKERIEAHLMPEDYQRFKELAKKENRSLKNHLETLVLKYLEDHKKKGGKG